MANGKLVGAAHRVAEHLGLFDTRILHQRGDIVSHGLVGQGPVDSGVAMPLPIDVVAPL
jgi:hypothetical protein